MPGELVWLVVILGLVALAACIFVPREVGKEDEPIVDVHVDLPSMEELSQRMRDARLLLRRGGRTSSTESGPQLKVTPEAPAEPPLPLGAAQPVLAQQPLPDRTLPAPN